MLSCCLDILGLAPNRRLVSPRLQCQPYLQEEMEQLDRRVSASGRLAGLELITNGALGQRGGGSGSGGNSGSGSGGQVGVSTASALNGLYTGAIGELKNRSGALSPGFGAGLSMRVGSPGPLAASIGEKEV